MLILIDGYNLLFQSQLVGRGRGQGWLQRARNRLVRLLSSGLPIELVGKTTIVFDASQPVDPQSDYVTQEGIRIVFAVEHPEADDLLEEMIRAHPTPKRLQVVSSDLRIQRCGRSRRAQVIDSESFLQRCESGFYRRQSARELEPLEESSGEIPELSQEEIEFWMREFRGHKESE
jgi:uncharacterized protein